MKIYIMQHLSFEFLTGNKYSLHVLGFLLLHGLLCSCKYRMLITVMACYLHLEQVSLAVWTINQLDFN